MELQNYWQALMTESVNPRTLHIDTYTTADIVRCINEDDQMVALAVKEELPHVVQAVDLIYNQLRRGGRLFYVGAGTSGRLGVLDASECPPTFGVDPQMVQGIIAGGDTALRKAIEGAEDDAAAGEALVEAYGMNANDVMVGITASGSARYVLAAARKAHALGMVVIAVVNNSDSLLGEISDVCIAPVVGPEVVMGSTRMKAGTATKMVLNMLSTAVMIKLGKVYGNLMVDLSASNDKLTDRATRIICLTTDLNYAAARKLLTNAGGETKTAILMAKTGSDAQQSRLLLKHAQGILSRAIELDQQVQAQRQAPELTASAVNFKQV